VLTEEHLTVFARLVNTSSQEGLESQSTSRTPGHINPAMLERAHFPVSSVCCDETCHELFYAVALPFDDASRRLTSRWQQASVLLWSQNHVSSTRAHVSLSLPGLDSPRAQ